MAEFKHAYNKTKQYEGGYANVPNDRGGETYMGISRKYYPAWEGWKTVDKHKPLQHNEIIKDAQLDSLVMQFYYYKFWSKLHGDYIESQCTADLLYDYYVHSGMKAIKAVQGIVGVTEDGIVGVRTLNAINGYAGDLFLKLKAQRRQFLYDLSEKQSQRKFRKGWLARVDNF